MMRHGRGASGAFTILELLVVFAILAILAGLILPNFESILNRAQSVVCTGRLRNLWTAFSIQLNDGKGWPQIPAGTEIGSISEQQWWLDTTSNSMGLTRMDWNCPTILRMAGSASNTQSTYLISYLPTLFDSNPITPARWPQMPWFTESIGFHGSGNLSVRADGSVSPMTTP